MTMSSRTLIGLSMVVALACTACDRVDLLAPSGSSVTVSAGTRLLPTGGSTEVQAYVLESSGTPVQNGTTVRFSTTLGRMDPIEAQTRNGLAVATFHAGDLSGVARITAMSGGAGASTSGTTTPPATGNGNTSTTTTSSGNGFVEITVGAAGAAAVLVSANPSTVPSTGGTTTIAASAVDGQGNRLTNVPISFSTTAGSLSAPSALSDATGEARVQLTTDREATVTARAGGQTATVTVRAATLRTVNLTISPQEPVAGQPATLTVAPSDATGTPPPRVVINWGDGTTEDIGVVPASRGVTHIYAAAGFYVITATVTSEGETFTTSLGVTVRARPSVELSVNPTSGRVNVTQFVFTITPAIGTVPQNVVIDFGDGNTNTLGAITQPTQATHVYSAQGTFTVRATQTNADGSTSTAVVVITVTP
jgi:hypothetical protein